MLLTVLFKRAVILVSTRVRLLMLTQSLFLNLMRIGLLEAAACIGCGACVAACPNASGMLFTAAKVTHLGLLPQGKVENLDRVVKMMNQHDKEGFGSCTNFGECAAACPKSVPLETIANLNRQLGKALLKGK